MTRDRGGWTQASRDYVERVRQILYELRAYWPVTLRQVYYRLVAAQDIPNETNAYKKLSRMLAKARLDGLVSWEAVEDRTRRSLTPACWDSSDHFIREETEDYLHGYRRDLLEAQEHALEVWVEKDALSHVCYRGASPYCVPVVVARGFSSVTYLHECRCRINRNATRGKSTVILYFGDLDPSGWEMLPSMAHTLQVEMEVGGAVKFERCALLPEQVEHFDLPHNPDALKVTDSRAKKYVERFGDLAVELDALAPSELEKLVRDNIERWLDLELLQEEREAEQAESEGIHDLRQEVQALVSRSEWEGIE